MTSEPTIPSIHLLAERLGIEYRSELTDFEPANVFTKYIPIAYAREHGIIGLTPLKESSDAVDSPIVLAIHEKRQWAQRDILSRRLGVDVEVILSDRSSILQTIDSAYSSRENATSDLVDQFDESGVEGSWSAAELAALSSREDLLDSDTRAPVIRLVNRLLFDAVIAGASDIHVQPYEDHLQVRQRIDGVLFDAIAIPKIIQEEVLTRIKVLGRMNIAEKRLPQDGRATVQLGSRVVDLRIASLPTSHNERIVIRLLDKSARRYTLDDLGMPEAIKGDWNRLIRRDHGLILVTGPTGSGKSTTLYGALQSVNSKSANILTLEDPIEYQLDGISQTQINEKKGLTFAAGMRSLLRQDPDVIMVGEIRDAETATMAIQASLTGHLVFSTLHTNDAASAITRLLDLGVQPYLLASSLVASLAQRLVRRICPTCEGSIGSDCRECRGSGFRGRIGLFELLVVDEPCRSQITQRQSASEIRESALQSGMTLLAEDGKTKVVEGLTTLDEVMRVTQVDGLS